jgi:hypothetical protein
MCRSPCSRVAALFLNPNGGMVRLSNTSAGCNPYVMTFGNYCEMG